jgi:hypothetical protein
MPSSTELAPGPGPFRAGWWLPSFSTRLHFFDGWGLSLCGKYNVHEQVKTIPDQGPNTVQCRLCRRKLTNTSGAGGK